MFHRGHKHTSRPSDNVTNHEGPSDTAGNETLYVPATEATAHTHTHTPHIQAVEGLVMLTIRECELHAHHHRNRRRFHEIEQLHLHTSSELVLGLQTLAVCSGLGLLQSTVPLQGQTEAGGFRACCSDAGVTSGEEPTHLHWPLDDCHLQLGSPPEQQTTEVRWLTLCRMACNRRTTVLVTPHTQSPTALTQNCVLSLHEQTQQCQWCKLGSNLCQ